MSLEVLLIPLGIAAIAAIRETSSADHYEKYKSTRITDQQLLQDGLLAMGTTNIRVGEGVVTAGSPYGQLSFLRVGETFHGRVDSDDSQTSNMLTALDMTVGTLLQQRTVESLHARAAEMGMKLVSQSTSNGEVQLVFEEVT
ncbi:MULTISPECIES: hypothetical protein [Glutamicibacter]|uniref:hypothetical protein n=1 Tax=Glutamicibacter TaxID=1742989 RepID=UPI000EF0DAFC|nr:hypothetical protein [Glutamicibacter sp.]HCJ54341.1 hypothetical protein [Glutamicibacter sp.]